MLHQSTTLLYLPVCHSLLLRLNSSHAKAVKYMAQFPSHSLASMAKFVAFVTVRFGVTNTYLLYPCGLAVYSPHLCIKLLLMLHERRLPLPVACPIKGEGTFNE